MMSRTAHVHPQAKLVPSKIQLLAAWLPGQPWFDGDPSRLERVATFRLVDPDGEVGLDCMVIASDGALFHVPLTWRATPLDTADLVGTLEHSVLGTRYCYDAPSDPVYMAEVARVIREADTDADVVGEGEDGPRARSISVHGTGSATGRKLGDVPFIVRKLDGIWPVADAHMVGTWRPDGMGRSDVLATLD